VSPSLPIRIPISFEDMLRLCAKDSGLPAFIRDALADRKRTVELTLVFESTLTEDEARSFLVYAGRHGFRELASDLRRRLWG
jgi:hypothetical protein